MGVLDSSFLFLPFGNDLLVIALVARHHEGYLIYVLTATLGSTLGVFFLDLIARRIGEGGVTKVAGQRQFNYLRRKIGQHGAKALWLGSLAPPPFPFTMVVAINSALGYPRKRLLASIAASRAIRFLILGGLAIKFGRAIIHIANSAVFKDVMYVFTAICLLGSGYSIVSWIRKSRNRTKARPINEAASTPSERAIAAPVVNN
jgi:membrane protein YqaA with SNARE-associated domain